MHYDYIIVGQGIAGTMLSNALLKHHKKILVVDQSFSSTSLAIGGGMYSPIIFKRFTKAWMVDKLLPQLIRDYTELEQLLNIHFLDKKDILRIFASEQEKKLWQNKCIEEAYWNYLYDEIVEDYSPLIHAPYGYGRVKNAGSVNLHLLLNAFRNYLKLKKLLREERLNYEEIIFEDGEVKWKGVSAKKIIFCEGYYALNNNPFFNDLPFVLAKGELLKAHPLPHTNWLKSPLDFCPPKGREQRQHEIKLPEDYIISSGVNISPIGNDEFIIGSTYSWDDLSFTPTEKGKEELLSKLKKVLNVDIEVTSQFSGIRPTVKDRRPLMGLHPQNASIGIFNGMGTKGVMLAPYFAEHFTNHLLNNADLLPEVYAFRHVKENNKK